MSVLEITVKAYKSTLANRRFFTKRAAIKADAIAIIKKKYPSAKHEVIDGYIANNGFHWTQLNNAEKLLKRLMRLISISAP